jgi:hypothetical protein
MLVGGVAVPDDMVSKMRVRKSTRDEQHDHQLDVMGSRGQRASPPKA